MKNATRTLAPSATKVAGERFKSFADLGAALAQASQEAASDALAQNRADVKEAKRLRRNRGRREQYAAKRAAK